MDKSQNENLLWSQYADRLCGEYRENNRIAPENYERIDVKRGLRNADGTGVVAGLTQICNVHGYVIDEGEKAPIEGELTYRGISIGDLIDGCTRENLLVLRKPSTCCCLAVCPPQRSCISLPRSLLSIGNCLTTLWRI